MSAQANLRSKLSLDDSPWVRGWRGATNTAKRAARTVEMRTRAMRMALRSATGSVVGMTTRIAAMGAALATVAVPAAFLAGLKKALDLGGRLSDVAERIGDTAGNSLILETAFQQAGLSAEKMGTAVQKMQRAIIEAKERGGTLTEPFDALGLDLNELADLDTLRAFDLISRKIAGLETATERSARAMQIFGKAGGELLPLFRNEKAIENAISMVGRQAELLTEYASEFDRSSDIVGGLGTKVQGFFVGVASQLNDEILPALESLNRMDLTGLGEQLGASAEEWAEKMEGAVDSLRVKIEAGTLGQSLTDQLAAAFLDAGDYLIRLLEAAAVGFGAALENAMTRVLKGAVTGGTFGIGKALLGKSGRISDIEKMRAESAMHFQSTDGKTRFGLARMALAERAGQRGQAEAGPKAAMFEEKTRRSDEAMRASAQGHVDRQAEKEAQRKAEEEARRLSGFAAIRNAPMQSLSSLAPSVAKMKVNRPGALTMPGSGFLSAPEIFNRSRKTMSNVNRRGIIAQSAEERRGGMSTEKLETLMAEQNSMFREVMGDN